MRKILARLFMMFLALSSFAELKYIEIGSKQNLPMIKIKTIEDFEAIIKAYDITVVFLQFDVDSRSSRSVNSMNSDAFVIVNNTYFSFSMEGYKTLADYKAGKNAKFKNAADYEKSKTLGIANLDFFYYYDRNLFRTVEDADEAYKTGFVFYKSYEERSKLNLYSSLDDNDKKEGLIFNENLPKGKESEAYYESKKLGYTNYADYKEYLDFKAKGFNTKDEYLTATSKGFSNGKEYKIATEAGFLNFEEYKISQDMGLKTKSEFDVFNEITSSIDKIIDEKKIDKKNAIIYYFIQKLPKEEMSISVLSKTLNELYFSNSDEIRKALSLYEVNAKIKVDHRREDDSFLKRLPKSNKNFSTDNLKKFFKEVDFSKVGSYSEKSEIFKRK